MDDFVGDVWVGEERHGGWWPTATAAVGTWWLGQRAAAPQASPAFHVACHKPHLLPRGMTMREHQAESFFHVACFSFHVDISYTILDCLDAVGLLASLETSFRICTTEARAI